MNRVLGVGLHAITGRLLQLRGSHDLAPDPSPGQRSVQTIPGRAGLIGQRHRPRQITDPGPDAVGAGNLTVIGRLKDVIIRKGETISARAIEDDLLAHPAVAEVAVIGLPHEAYGETACAVVVRNGPETLTLADLTALLEARGLPKRQWPERLVLRDDLPRSSTGKVLKSDLRAGILAG